MSDELGRQLEAFGATLESSTGEPVRASEHGIHGHDRSRHRAWATAGAAACLLAVVVGLVVVTGRDAEAPTAQPAVSTPTPTPAPTPAPAPTSTTIPMMLVPEVVPTTIAPTIPSTQSEPVPDDPLALERDGWTLVQRTDEPFAAGEVPCEAAQGLADFDGVASVHDILTSPDGNGLDLDVQVLDVGSTDRGNELASAVSAIRDCIGDMDGIEVETGAMSSVRASWFRAGPDFALVTIVGEGSRSIVLEIENAPFDDDLIGELVLRADQFLRGDPVSAVPPVGGITVMDGSTLGAQQVEPGLGQVKLWVSNQSFEDDPVAIEIAIDGTSVVDDSFEVGGQHNWFSFMIDGLEPGEHALTATSDTGAVLESTFTLPPGEPRWMVVDYWSSADEELGRHFTVAESDEPITFA